MSEKIKFVVIHPMCGHSRGEWYATLDDIVESEENAEYSGRIWRNVRRQQALSRRVSDETGRTGCSPKLAHPTLISAKKVRSGSVQRSLLAGSCRCGGRVLNEPARKTLIANIANHAALFVEIL